MKMLEFRLKLGTGADWEALGPIPEPFPFSIDADCTTLAFKHYLSHKILNGVFEPGNFQLRLQGCDKELEDVADAGQPTTSTHQPQLRRLASQGVCNGSVLQLDVCATEEELQRFLDAAEECGTANELGHVEEQQEAQTPPAAGVDPRQRHAAEGSAAAAGDGPTGRPSLGMMHTPAGTVGTFLDDEDADYLQEDLEALVQPAAQRAGEEELDHLNVAADGEPFEAEDAEDFEAHGRELRGAGGVVGAPQQQHPAFAAAAEGREQEGDDEDWGDMGLRSAGTRTAGQPERRAAVATPARKQQQQQQRPRANLQSAAKRARREAPEEELDFVSGSADEGAQPAQQQQCTHGAAIVGGSTRGAAAPARAAATGAATAAGAAAPRSQPPRQPALARSTGLPAAMQPAVDTGAFSAYGGGGGQQRASSGFWSLEETERLVEWVDSHGARQWTMFVQLNTDLHRDVEQVKMKWRNLKNASKKRWTVARRVPPPDLRARIDEIVRRDT